MACEGTGRFSARHPTAWHVIEADGIETCRQLHPASTLRRLAGAADDGLNRLDYQRLNLPDGQVAVLRPQMMRDRASLPSFAGSFAGDPASWRRHVDRHVFFWLSADRRDKFVAATIRERPRSPSAPDRRPPLILAFDTAALLARHSDQALFSRINVGSAVRGGARVRRDENTLLPLTD